VNIFAVDENPFAAAKDLPDKLVVKMPTESIQMLTPWLYNKHGVKIEKPDTDGQFELLEENKRHYGVKGFAHHPCSKWLYQTDENVLWLIEHAFGLCEEYWSRYGGKQHGSLYALNKIREFVYRSANFGKLYSKGHSPFVQAMPDQYKDPTDPVSAYRNYLIGEKGYAEWRYCAPPKWWDTEKHKPVREKYLAEKELKKLQRRNAKHSSTERSLQS
jgi:hypothetical protein